MKFRGHETFFIRKGWLYKGLKNIEKNKRIFNDKDSNPTDDLGIGTNMVKSLRYWLQAVGLTAEDMKENKKYQYRTKLGKLVWKYDRYIEEDGTLWLLHYNLASNEELATTWHWFYNEFNMKEFTKEDFVEDLDGYIKYNLEEVVAKRSLNDDYNCLINTYISRKKMNPEKKISPENNIDCPLGTLELLDKVDKNVFRKATLKKDTIHPLIVLSVMIDRYSKNENESKEVKIASLLNDDCNIGKIFNMDWNVLNHYLDVLQEKKYLRVIRTAGLDVVKIDTDLDVLEIVEEYYKDINQ
ncbi:DUF4007 family protein [Lutibacter sp. B2]|nr:DUF4007 family protein [Lutibacter sp. B2]